MHIYDDLDILFLVVLGLFNFVLDEGPVELLLLLWGLLPRAFIRTPARVMYTRHLENYSLRPLYARHSSGFEYWATQQLRWLLSNLNPEITSRSLFGRKTFTTLYNVRRFRHGIGDVGDVQHRHRKYNLYEGFWVTSRTCGTDFDLVIMFVPGCAAGAVSPYFYLEFVALLLAQLRERGFRAPGIFVLDTKFRRQSYSKSLDIVHLAWAGICDGHPSATRALMGSGIGATAVLTLMLHAVKPLSGLPLLELTKPDLVLLISPLVKLARTRADSRCDFLTDQCLARFATKSLDILDTTEIWAMPGEVRDRQWWYRALPELGLHVTYGREEMLAPEIRELIKNLSGCRHRVTALEQPNQLHAWPLANCYLARNKVAHFEGVQLLGLRIAEMALWYTVANSHPASPEPPKPALS